MPRDNSQLLMKTSKGKNTSLEAGDQMHIESTRGNAVLMFFTRGTQSLYFRKASKARIKFPLDNKHECCSEESALDTIRLITGLTGLSFKLIRNEEGLKTYKLV